MEIRNAHTVESVDDSGREKKDYVQVGGIRTATPRASDVALGQTQNSSEDILRR